MTREAGDLISYVLSGLILTGITGMVIFARKLAALPRQMIIVTAALFRLLRSNKLQGIALEKVAECQKKGCADGDTDVAVAAVTKDRDKTEEFFKKVALTPQEKLEDLLKEDE